MAPSTPRRANAPSRSSLGGRLPRDSKRESPGVAKSEPARRKARYIPGGPGGGGRYLYDDGSEAPVGGTGPGGYNYTGPRGRIGPINAARGVVAPATSPRPKRDKSTRTRTAPMRSQDDKENINYGPTSTSATAVPHNEGYKPREERGWEEFHPQLDIDLQMSVYTADEVDGTTEARPSTPTEANNNSITVITTPMTAANIEEQTPGGSTNGDTLPKEPLTTPRPKRGPGRPPLNPELFYRSASYRSSTTGRIAPLEIQSSKERLTLPRPSFRSIDAFERFGKMPYVDKAMAHAGYQESDEYIRPDSLVRHSDSVVEADADLVEYDMDEQDDQWLRGHNEGRRVEGFNEVSHEVFEITITKLEKEYHALEKRIPKANPRPPQTHRPRSSSAAAVNGEPQVGEEQDSKCAICDDGDCENTNAIVFCDGCDLAVHQECYGVPFIPEGQWHCRKCQVAGRGVPTCIFCPNTDGGFKQTNSSTWAHLLCAMWIPEVSLGNHTFMEPIMDVERVPSTRWKLNCYICHQKMGACIQCGNKSCYQAFHVTCARRARLHLKMKNNHGALAVLDVAPVLTAFCDKHGPAEYSKDNQVSKAIKNAKRFYRRKMKNRVWAKNRTAALQIAASHSHTTVDLPGSELPVGGGRITLTIGDKQNTKTIWKLPSGAPVIPAIVFDIVEKYLQKFNIHQRKSYLNTVCRYWTLKREAKRGAPLIKRFQLTMEGFSSMEITRRNFAGMGPVGRGRLDRRMHWGTRLNDDLSQLTELGRLTHDREGAVCTNTKHERETVDTMYFPIHKVLVPVFAKAIHADSKHMVEKAFSDIQKKLESRFYVHAMGFARDLATACSGILSASKIKAATVNDFSENISPSKKTGNEFKERKKIINRILKAVNEPLNAAVRAEADVFQVPEDDLLRELVRVIATSTEAPIEPKLEIEEARNDADIMDTDGVEAAVNMDADTHITDVEAMEIDMPANGATEDVEEAEVFTPVPPTTKKAMGAVNGLGVVVRPSDASKTSDTPPDSNGFIPHSEQAVAQPPTPPISNGGSLSGTTQDSTANDVRPRDEGGVPWYIKQFEPSGTAAVIPKEVEQEDGGSDALSDMDDDTFKGMDVQMSVATEEVVVPPPPVKSRKTRGKRRSGRYR